MNKIIAGTGHRPPFCPCKYDDKHPWLTSLKYTLIDIIEEEEPETIIAGGALGFDTWLAQAALYTNTPLHLYIPCPNFCSKWPSKSQDIYHDILSKADSFKYIREEYTRSCCIERDQAMVDDADEIWSLLNPAAKSGGTFKTVEMARKQNKPIVNFWTYCG